MSDEMDPEVLADIRLRDATTRDQTRTGEARWAPPRIMDRVPCRNRCGSLADWTEEAEDAFQKFNRILASKAEAPLDKTRIMFCRRCWASGEQKRADGLRAFYDKVNEAIRELRAGCGPDRVRELLEKLRKAGHPDVKGLEQCLRDKANAKGSQRAARVKL